MEKEDLEFLTICSVCGCVFDFTCSQKYQEPKTCVCPACKHEYEIPAKYFKNNK